MMSIIIDGGKFYFQTDKDFRKYEQIKGNPHVALCIDNLSIEPIYIQRWVYGVHESGACCDNGSETFWTFG